MSESQHQLIKTRYRGHLILCRRYLGWYPSGTTLFVVDAADTGGSVWGRGSSFHTAMASVIQGIDLYEDKFN